MTEQTLFVEHQNTLLQKFCFEKDMENQLIGGVLDQLSLKCLLELLPFMNRIEKSFLKWSDQMSLITLKMCQTNVSIYSEDF